MKVFTLLVLACACARSQTDLNAKTRDQVIANALDRLDAEYVDPQIAKKMIAAVRERQRAGAYDSLNEPMLFAKTLERDLVNVSHDRHLHVEYSQEPITEGNAERFRKGIASTSFGLDEPERLPGNIGYLKIRHLVYTEHADEKTAAVMSSLVDSSALIIDLRYCGGGQPAMVQRVASYLFGERPVHLDDLYDRPENSTKQLWTLAELPGRRLPSIDVYLLTSHGTFSGGEEFAYDLQCLKRATIIGEITGGGAHGGALERIGEHFIMFVPSGRMINAITKTDWEGGGVKPDVAVAAERALKTAQIIALRKIAERTSAPQVKAQLHRLIRQVEKEPNWR